MSDIDGDLALTEPLSPIPSQHPDPEGWTTVFNSRQDADIVLKTSDDYKIPAHKWPLSRISEVFEAMFKLPQHESWTFDDDLPVVELPDRAAPVVNLLTVIYPEFEGRLFFTPDEIRDALELAEKYDVLRARYSLKCALQSPKFISDNPLDCYSVAVKYGYDDIRDLAVAELRKRNYWRQFADDLHLRRLLERHHLTGLEFWEMLQSIRSYEQFDFPIPDSNISRAL